MTLFLLAVALFLMIGLPSILFAPWVPTRRRDFDRLNQFMDIKPGMEVLDLGCGTGSVIFELAKRHPKATFVGIELSLLLYLVCQIRRIFFGQKNVRFVFGDLMGADVSRADRIYLFGMPKSLSQTLKKKFHEQGKPGLKIISYCFAFEGWETEAVLPKDGSLMALHRYLKP